MATTLLPLLAAAIVTIGVHAATARDGFALDGFADADLVLTGSADITSDGTLRLTDQTKESQGHAFHPSPLSFNDTSAAPPRSFSTTFVFAILPGYPSVSGHGITFALSPSKDLPWAMPSRSLGLFNLMDNGDPRSHIVAIELDTAQDVEFHDINDNHVGIDVNGLISKNSTPVAYFDSAASNFKELRLISGEAMQAWVDYDGGEMRMDVTVSQAGTPKPAIPLLEYKVDLSSVLADETYVGFTAANGAATSAHLILGWSFTQEGHAQDLNLRVLPQIPTVAPAKKKPLVREVLLILMAAILLLMLIVGLVCVIIWRKKYDEIQEEWEADYGPHRIRYKDLHKATRGFDEANIIGVGGFGRVYRGTVPKSGNQIAVKKISHNSRQGMREFVSEIASMSRLRHRNLVQLHGYCRRQGELILVYEYMANSSLDKFLFTKSRTRLNWNQRFNIIKGVASGLFYLHEGWEQVVIHRDIKASNVLLDKDMNAKLSDFGLARLHDHGKNPHTTNIVGTLGYIAPELSKTGKATESTDVFAFGVFLLEVACGRRPVDFRDEQDSPGLVDLVLDLWKRGIIIEARDSSIGLDYNEEELELVLKLGLLCSHPEPKNRPSMRQVLQFLERNSSLPNITLDGHENSTILADYDVLSHEVLQPYSSEIAVITYPSLQMSSPDSSRF